MGVEFVVKYWFYSTDWFARMRLQVINITFLKYKPMSIINTMLYRTFEDVKREAAIHSRDGGD